MMQRPSMESDRLHLLSAEHNLPPPALTSQAPSVLSRTSSRSTVKGNADATAGDIATTESAPPLSTAAAQARRFTKSEEEYLAALRAWVEEKQYISLGPQTEIQGFYGKKTMDMYAAEPGLNWGRKSRSKSQITPEDLDVNGRRRRTTIAAPETNRVLAEEARVPGQRRKSIKNWLVKR